MWLIDLLQKVYQGLGIVILYRIDFFLHLHFKHYHTATCKRNSCSLSHLLQGFPESICGTGVLLSTWDKSPVLLFVELNQYQGPLRRAGTSSARRGVWCLRNPSPWKRERQLFAAAVLGHQNEPEQLRLLPKTKRCQDEEDTRNCSGLRTHNPLVRGCFPANPKLSKQKGMGRRRGWCVGSSVARRS